MDYPSTASGESGGKPLLVLSPTPDQDHPDTMNQIIWSLMYILEQAEISAAPFDPETASTYTKLYQALTVLIDNAVPALATVAQMRTGTADNLAATPQGVSAVLGNYSQYITNASADNFNIPATAMGGLIAGITNAASHFLPAANSCRVGSAFTVINLKATGNITVSRSGENTIAGIIGSTTGVTLGPLQSATFIVASDSSYTMLRGNASPFQKEQWLDQQTITTTRLYTFAHGLGVKPKFVQLYLVNITAQAGYTTGQEVPMPLHQIYIRDSGARGYAVRWDETNVYLSIDANHTMGVHEWNQNDVQDLDNNKWAAKFYVAA